MYKMLRHNGQFLATEKGPPYINTEWGETQLKNIAKYHNINIQDIEVVNIQAVEKADGK